MKRKLATLAIAALMFSVLPVVPTNAQSGGTTYTQTNHACLINQCSNAEFNPAATLDYTNSIRFYGNQSFIGTATWNGTEYTDFSGTFTYLGQHAGRATWQLNGTFNEGRNVVTEEWVCFRSCSTGDNVSGSVVQN